MSNHQPVVDGGVTGKLPAPRPSVGSWRVPPSPWEQPRSRAGLDRRIPVSPSSAPRKLSLGGSGSAASGHIPGQGQGLTWGNASCGDGSAGVSASPTRNRNSRR